MAKESEDNWQILEEKDSAKITTIEKEVRHKFNLPWLNRVVAIGEEVVTVGEHMKKVSIPGKVFCLVCEKLINYQHRGSIVLVDHIKTKNHGKNAEARKSNGTGSVLASPVKPSKESASPSPSGKESEKSMEKVGTQEDRVHNAQLFWDSDDQGSKIRRRTRGVSVTFKDATSPRSNASRSPDTTMPRPSHHRQDDMAAIEGDTDTDDEMFRRSPSRRTRSRRDRDNKIPLKKVMEDDGNDEEEGLRRSSRKNKSNKFDQSWLVGNKKLRGYPTMVASSEPENEDPRPSRKLRRNQPARFHNSDSQPWQHRKLRRYSKSDEPISLPPATRARRPSIKSLPKSDPSDEETDIPRMRRRIMPPRKYREEPDNSEEEVGRVRTRRESRLAVHSRAMDREEENTTLEMESDEATPAESSKNEPEEEREAKDSENENENAGGNEEEEDEDELPQTRRTTRSSLGSAGQKIEDTEDDEEEEEERPVMHRLKKPSSRAPRDPIMACALAQNFSFEELSSKSKRERRPVKRYMYEDDVPETRRTQKRVSSSDESEKDDEEDDDEDEEEEEENEEQNGARYSLRQRRESRPFQLTSTDKSSRSREYRGESPPRRHHRNHKRYLESPARKHHHHHKRRAAHNTSTSSSSSSDESRFEKRKAKSMNKARNRCLPMNFSPEDLAIGSLKDRSKIGSSLADVDPMSVDREVSFDSVGGLAHHVKALKEMVIFPLMYPEVFERFKIAPPRGVLFYGPPGTGKTLVARALANECSFGEKKVAFFMRKGADCLSKWVGESERQLRLLFDQAYQMRPSIIFFDEIDGLAPVRSSRQDQIHSSIVSTLLALMDGLDSRGEVVVIGATNRIDAIDPALRRPGRFDREFHFPLPSVKARRHILKIHMDKWEPQPSNRLMHHLAEQTVGYCGADLKSLCAEAALVALRAKYPQIYASKQKLVIDVGKINVCLAHFRAAMNKIVAAGQRSAATAGRRLSKTIQPLFQSTFQRALSILKSSFPHAFAKGIMPLKNRSTHRPRLVLTGMRSQGQSTHLGPAIVHALEKVHTHKLDLSALFSVSARAPEEACAQIFHEARRNLPSIIYVPHIDQWWNTTSDTLQATFTTLLLDIDPASPLLLLATSDVPYDELDHEVQLLFSVYREEVLQMTNPTEEERRHFFRPLFFTNMVQKPKVPVGKRQLEELPVAPIPEQRQLNSKEVKKLEYIEEATLRELRIFLREICTKLAKNRTFYIFTKPVDEEEVPDYREIIKEPMDLETMMTKIDQHEYECAQEFLSDIDLICTNALEYNPDRDPEDKIIRHRACTLRDTAYAYIKAEMDTDFEERCRDIRDQRKIRYTTSTRSSNSAFALVASKTNLNVDSKDTPGIPGRASAPVSPITNSAKYSQGKQMKSTGEIHRKRKRRKFWARGYLKKIPKKRLIEKYDGEKKVEPGVAGGEDVECKDDDEDEDEECQDKSHLENENECGKSEGEEDVSVHSTDNSDDRERARKNSEEHIQGSTVEVHAESEVILCNGHLSTEDSHDSMKVTSAGDELAAKASTSHLSTGVEGCKSSSQDKSQDTIEAEDSVVSSSEQGGSSLKTTGILIDWGHLEAVYESCISATEGDSVDELQRLHTAIFSLIHKYLPNTNRTLLLQETEAEIRRYTQYHKKS